MENKTVAEKALAKQVLEAKDVNDVRKLIESAKEVYNVLEPRPVGDRPNNIGTIRLGSDPALGLVERVTNGMDALLHLGRLQDTSGTPKDPREAARMWYGVPFGGLAEMTEAERRNLAQNLRLWLEDSGTKKRPTVVIEDKGTGQPAAAFPDTLVSLNESNKVGQPWTMGTYGQGGAVTFGFSEATVILSRPHPHVRGDGENTIAWTVVQRYEDPNREAYPSYKYLVTANGEVPQLDPALLPGFEHGTRVIHVSYDLQGWTGPFTTGIWQLFHSAIFDPVLPFEISGKRSNDSSGSRIVVGNAARLQRIDKARGDVEITHHDSVKMELGEDNGYVTFNYWVVQRPEGSTARDDSAAESYVRADTAVSMTLFGQRQDAESRSWIKSSAKLPFLYKNMIVQVDADHLTPVAKGEVFTSTRERGTRSDLREKIYQQLGAQLRDDGELGRLNAEAREKLLQKSATASSSKVQQRLAKFIKTRLKDKTKPGSGGTEDGTGGTKKPRKGSISKPRDIDDSHLPNFPSKLSFERKNIKISQGSRGYSWVEIDAKNGYLPDNDDSLSFTWEGNDPEGKIRLVTRSKLLGGKSRWLFQVDGDTETGNYEFWATLITPNGVVSDSVTVTVTVPQPAKPAESGNEPETGPRVEWINREDWESHGIDGRDVGYVTADEETIIWVNRHYVLLDKALAGRSLTPEQIETRANRYQYPVACALWLQDDAASRSQQAPDEKYQKAELERVAEAVLAAIEPDVDVASEEGED